MCELAKKLRNFESDGDEAFFLSLHASPFVRILSNQIERLEYALVEGLKKLPFQKSRVSLLSFLPLTSLNDLTSKMPKKAARKSAATSDDEGSSGESSL